MFTHINMGKWSTSYGWIYLGYPKFTFNWLNDALINNNFAGTLEFLYDTSFLLHMGNDFIMCFMGILCCG